jgi:hypothetical protein
MKVDPAGLKKAVLELIAEVHSIHQAGGGTLRLGDLVTKLKIPTEATAQQLLSHRGDMTFIARATDNGVFENHGTEVRLSTKVAQIVIPPVIAGIYVTTADTLSLQMNSGQTVLGKKGFLSAPVESIGVDHQKAYIRVGGFLSAMLSKTFLFTDIA